MPNLRLSLLYSLKRNGNTTLNVEACCITANVGNKGSCFSKQRNTFTKLCFLVFFTGSSHLTSEETKLDVVQNDKNKQDINYQAVSDLLETTSELHSKLDQAITEIDKGEKTSPQIPGLSAYQSDDNDEGSGIESSQTASTGRGQKRKRCSESAEESETPQKKRGKQYTLLHV